MDKNGDKEIERAFVEIDSIFWTLKVNYVNVGNAIQPSILNSSRENSFPHSVMNLLTYGRTDRQGDL